MLQTRKHAIIFVILFITLVLLLTVVIFFNRRIQEIEAQQARDEVYLK
jgi:hypothetical protein